MSTDKQHAAFYKIIDAKTPKVNAWFKREEAKLIAAEQALAKRREVLRDQRSEKLALIEREAHSASRRCRD